VETGVGVVTGTARGTAEGEGEALGGTGVAIESNSVTVTDLKPFFWS
jgi:hypothetical protein